MIHVDRVLFPTDGSDCAERARQHALHLANQFEANLHIVQVEEREVQLTDVVDVKASDILADLHGLPDEGYAPLAEPRVFERTITYPSAAGGILTYATEHDTHLIVLGTHGRRGMRRLVLGSVAEEVIRRSPRPVVTVGRGAVAPEAMEGGCMLVPVDFSEFQDRLLAHAREIARVYGMDVVLLHVIETEGVPEVYGVRAANIDLGVLEERAEEALAEEVESLQDQGIDASVEIRRGHPADQTLEAAVEMDASFITIATHGRTGIERVLMGSVAEKVIRQARCPVCTVKSFGTSIVDTDGASE